MLYIDYKFEINESGLTFTNIDTALEPNSQIKVENTPFKIGDTFVLTQKANDCMFFRRVDRRES